MEETRLRLLGWKRFHWQNWALAILNEEDFEMLIHNLFKGLSCKNDNHLFGLF